MRRACDWVLVNTDEGTEDPRDKMYASLLGFLCRRVGDNYNNVRVELRLKLRVSACESWLLPSQVAYELSRLDVC